MRSVELIGLCAIAAGWGFAAWKYFERDYKRAKERGGSEWLRIEKITTLSVIAAAVSGMVLTGYFLMWLDGK